jgi:hypothetical protein
MPECQEETVSKRRKVTLAIEATTHKKETRKIATTRAV